ncbi:hypothetical protein Tco_1176725 [Tanacetum coccineum]
MEVAFPQRNSFLPKVTDGANTSFWLDPWYDDGLRLKISFQDFLRLNPLKIVRLRIEGRHGLAHGLGLPESLWDLKKGVEWWSLPPPVSFPSFSVVESASGNINILGDANLIKATNRVLQIT